MKLVLGLGLVCLTGICSVVGMKSLPDSYHMFRRPSDDVIGTLTADRRTKLTTPNAICAKAVMLKYKHIPKKCGTNVFLNMNASDSENTKCLLKELGWASADWDMTRPHYLKLVEGIRRTSDTGLRLDMLAAVNHCWETCRPGAWPCLPSIMKKTGLEKPFLLCCYKYIEIACGKFAWRKQQTSA